MNDILFCIISCQKYVDKQNVQRNTWLKDQPHIFLSDEDGPDYVCISRMQGHVSCERKQLDGIVWLAKNRPDYQWYFFCDDDTFVNVPKLMQLLPKLDSRKAYGCLLSRDTDPENPCWERFVTLKAYLSGGAGFLLHNDVIRLLAEMDVWKYSTLFSDLSLGFQLQERHVPIVNVEGFHTNTPGSYKHSVEQIREAYTYHYVPVDMMGLLHTCVCESK